jgi:hypothetical protein
LRHCKNCQVIAKKIAGPMKANNPYLGSVSLIRLRNDHHVGKSRCSRHKDKAHIFANAEELTEFIPSAFEYAPEDVALREALATQMSRNNRPKLAIEYLEQHQIDELSNKREQTLKEPELEIF